MSWIIRIGTTAALGLLLITFSSLSSGADQAALGAAEPDQTLGATPTLRLDRARSLDHMIPELAKRRVVFVGEIHTRYDHHLIQLHLIEALAARHDKIAIGVEWFQQPFQAVLDRYIAGNIDERQLLLDSEYFQRWRYDYRLYAPILRYARAHRIPVVALNLPTEIISAVSSEGIDQVPPELRSWLPRTLDRSNNRYRDRLRGVFDAHPQTQYSDFERFYTVQLLWDEGMAERAAKYLQAHPDTHMVILAGSGHLAYGDGIPARLRRQIQQDAAIVLSQWEAGMSADLADYLVLSQPRSLPPAGALGVTIKANGDGGVRLREVGEDSAAAKAGARQGDHLLSIDGNPISSIADVRTALWEKQPGNRIIMTVQRAATGGPSDVEKLNVILQ